MKIFKGLVVSTKMDKTVTVKVERLMPHPLYKKLIKTNKNYLCQDDLGVKMGDMVEIKEVRPLSARKRFTVTKIEKAAKTA